jgi:hypothetical protein
MGGPANGWPLVLDVPFALAHLLFAGIVMHRAKANKADYERFRGDILNLDQQLEDSPTSLGGTRDCRRNHKDHGRIRSTSDTVEQDPQR